METEPLVNLKPGTRKMNYNSEDGSSILHNPQSTIEQEEEVIPSNTKSVSIESIGVNIGHTNNKDTGAILERFHEDALEQVGYGRMQVTLYFVCGLAMAVDLTEVMALIMSSKSAQFEFCVDEKQKSWIVGAALVGMGVGSLFWGTMGDRVGRRRALTYALGVGAIFNLASVIMPTEGTFLSARLCSGLGLGGCLPLVITYFSEFIPEKKRRFAIALLFLWWPIGAAYVIMLSWLILPINGLDLSDEIQHHFSSWRRLLLASTAPNLFCLVFFIFMPEAPLTLMQNGRDAESLKVYKSMHRRNRGSGSTFCFSEIEIPSVNLSSALSPRNVIGDLKEVVEQFLKSFLALWTHNRRRLTISFAVIWILAGVGQGALTSWVVSQQANIRDWTFDNDARMLDNKAYYHSTFLSDITNVRYRNSTFENVAIQNLTMNHVKFVNCTFHRVNFTNVRASSVLFIHSELSECFFVDTGLGRSNFQNCIVESITYEGLDPECHLIPDFSMELKTDVVDSGLPVLGIFVGAILSLIFLSFLPQSRFRIVACNLLLSGLVSVGLTIWTVDPIWAIIGHLFINVFVACSWSILITTIDLYPTCSRGVMLGLVNGSGRIGSFFGVGLFGTTLNGIIVPIFSSIFLVLSACVSFRTNF